MGGVLVGVVRDYQWVVWPVLAIIFALGLTATFAPGHFANIASRGSKWVDTDKVLQALDKPIDIDRHVLRYSRAFGMLVAVAAIWLAYVYYAHVLR